MPVIAASRCGLNIDDRPGADLESVSGSRPRGFESRILRWSDKGRSELVTSRPQGARPSGRPGRPGRTPDQAARPTPHCRRNRRSPGSPYRAHASRSSGSPRHRRADRQQNSWDSDSQQTPDLRRGRGRRPPGSRGHLSPNQLRRQGCLNVWGQLDPMVAAVVGHRGDVVDQLFLVKTRAGYSRSRRAFHPRSPTLVRGLPARSAHPANQRFSTSGVSMAGRIRKLQKRSPCSLWRSLCRKPRCPTIGRSGERPTAWYSRPHLVYP
jgi:hypothetical protein